MKKITYKSKDGTELSGVWHIPNQSTDKAIILAHGITVDKDEDGIFTDLSEYLKDNGFAIFRFDFRGHGESKGNSVDMTIQGELMDLEAALSVVKRQGYKSIGLLGASFGGGIATLFVPEHQDKIKCLCLWNPVLNYDHCFINPTLPWLRRRKDQMKKDLLEKGWTTLGSRKFKIGKSLFEEMVHYQRSQMMSLLEFGLKYIFSGKFRFNEELEANKTALKILKKEGIKVDLKKKAQILSSWLYFWPVSYGYALKQVKKAWEEA